MPLIKRLYIDENHTLHDVMKIMRRDHDFHSSYEHHNPLRFLSILETNTRVETRAKMYKLWLKRLGIRKNVRLQQQDIPYVLQLTSKASRAGPCGQVKLASGQVVDIERLASHLHRKRASPGLDALAGDGVDLDRFARAVCHYSGHNYALPPRIDEPDALRLPQLVLSDVESYIGSFGPGLGSVVLGLFTEPTLCSNYISMRFQVQSLDTSEPDPIMSIPPLARHVHLAIDTAAYFLANDEVDSAIAQLKIVPERIRLSLAGRGKEPPLTLALIWKVTLFLITSASTARPELEGIVRSLLKYIASIIGSSRTISPALRRIVNNLSDLYSIDGHLLNETAARGLAVYDKFCKSDSCSSSCFHFVRSSCSSERKVHGNNHHAAIPSHMFMLPTSPQKLTLQSQSVSPFLPSRLRNPSRRGTRLLQDGLQISSLITGKLGIKQCAISREFPLLRRSRLCIVSSCFTSIVY